MMEELENKLFDAAIQGSITSLQNLLREDPMILERTVANRFSDTPLHVAAMLGQTDFVREIVAINPQMVTELNSQQSTPLHLASAKGRVEAVKILLSADPQTHLARDRSRLTPLHLAALKGRIDVLKVLVQKTPDMAQLMVHRGENILHLCVKHHQLDALKLLVGQLSDTVLINAKDADGNTLLHLAVAYKQVETVGFLLAMPTIEVNAQNLNGMTALDTLIHSRRDLMDAEIQESLKRAGGVGAVEGNTGSYMNKDMLSQAPFPSSHDLTSSPTAQKNNLEIRDDWLDKQRGALMVVASLIATVAFQVGVNPPGGLWQDDCLPGNCTSDPHIAGSSILARNYPTDYTVLYIYNSTSFVSSLTIILLLISGLPITRRSFVWILTVIMWIAITATAITYNKVLLLLTPSVLENKSVGSMIGSTVMAWLGLTALLLISHTIRLIVKLVRWLRKTWRRRRIMSAGSAIDGA